MKPKNGIGIIGTGRALPSGVITNSDLTRLVKVSDDWIRSRTGIVERRKASPQDCASTLGIQAAVAAIDQARLHAEELDLLICSTICPDMPLPSTACHIQAAIGARRAVSFDLAAACSGFLYGVELSHKLIKSGAYRKALVVGVDLLTRYTDYTDSKTCSLFGDGAGAAVIGPVACGRGIITSHIASDGSLWDLVFTPAGGTRYQTSNETLEERMHFMKMKGTELFKVAVKVMTGASLKALQEAGLKPEDVDLMIPHQGNQRIINAVAERLGLASEKVYSNISRVGNTGAASIPIALDECVREKRVKPGSTLLLAAAGGGVTWGATVIKW